MKPSDRVNRIQDQDPKGATIRLVQGFAVLLDYDEGGQGWWPIEALELEFQPDWNTFRSITFGSTDFLLLLGHASQSENAELRARAAILPTTYLLAEQGSVAPFCENWKAFVEGMAIPKELVDKAVEAAKGCNLPDEFTESLAVL